MDCRLKCGDCCIVPSITSHITGMENGKLAGVKCIQLDENNMCKIFKDKNRPKVGNELKACKDMCGNNREEAIDFLTKLEIETSPN